MTTLYPSVYLRGKVYYFRYTNKNNFRVQKSTGCIKKSDAQKFVRAYVDRLQAGIDDEMSLRRILNLYTDPATNPRRRDASITEGNYGPRYAANVATDANTLLKTLDSSLLDCPLYAVNRRMLKDAAHTLVKSFGKTMKARHAYKTLKVAISQAADDGYLQSNPGFGLSDITTTPVRKMYALPSEDIRKALNHQEVFPNEKARNLFIILAACGLRRSELLALTPSQICGDALVINRAWKDDGMKIIGPPKWNKERTLAIPQVAKSALQELFNEDGSIGVNFKELASLMRLVGAHVSNLDGIMMPDGWKALTPHMLRHSLNTMLRVSGLPDVLVAEFMSWKHQVVNAEFDQGIQDIYTQLYVRNLKPVADTIDRLISPRKFYIEGVNDEQAAAKESKQA